MTIDSQSVDREFLAAAIRAARQGLAEGGIPIGAALVVDGGVVGGRLWTPHQQGVQAMRQAFGVSEG